MKWVLLALAVLSGAREGRAGSFLAVKQGERTIEGVKITTEAKARVAERAYTLKLVGAGLRFKKVAFLKANVYVGEFLSDAPEKILPNAAMALDSLSAMKAVAIRMTFLRDVEGKKIASSFADGLTENNVKLDDPAIKAFLAAVKNGGEAKEKNTLVVLGERLPDGKEVVTYEDAAGKLSEIRGEPGLRRSIFSIWLGKIEDSGLENLKKEMLKFPQ